MEIQAFAKLNLTLDILGKREDGYHDLRMVMQSITLADTLTLEENQGEGLRVSANLRFLPTGEKNLAAAAALRFWEALGREPEDLDIRIEKRIPVCAGMAGGSSDAAAVLRALNQRAGDPFSPKELARASLEELLDLKLGYRAKYIHRLSQDAAAGVLDPKKLETMEYGQAMEYLTGFYGIGKKVANCVCLFGLHHIEAFPVDTWIEKILLREYFSAKKYRRTPKNRLYDTILADHFGRYGGYAGVLQQYIFYYERLNQHKISP